MERGPKMGTLINTILAVSVGISGCSTKGQIDSGRVSAPLDTTHLIVPSATPIPSITPEGANCGGIYDACNPNPCGPGLICKPMGDDAAGCPISTCVSPSEHETVESPVCTENIKMKQKLQVFPLVNGS